MVHYTFHAFFFPLTLLPPMATSVGEREGVPELIALLLCIPALFCSMVLTKVQSKNSVLITACGKRPMDVVSARALVMHIHGVCVYVCDTYPCVYTYITK